VIGVFRGGHRKIDPEIRDADVCRYDKPAVSQFFGDLIPVVVAVAPLSQVAVGGLRGRGVGQLFGVGLFGGGGLLQLPFGRGAFVQQVQGVILGLGVAHGGSVGGCVQRVRHVGLLCHVRVSRCDGPRYPSCS